MKLSNRTSTGSISGKRGGRNGATGRCVRVSALKFGPGNGSTVPPAWPKRVVAPEVVARDTPKRFSLLGSTGSIGTQTLDIMEEFPEKFELVALAAGSNIKVLAEQVRKFKPKMVALRDASKLAELKEMLRGCPLMPEILVGDEGAVEVARHPDAEAVVTGIVGCAGLLPTVAAIKAGKDICLANKETLIAGGPFVLPLAAQYGVKILPADSEHSAIFQCMQGLPEGGLRRIILTASGGAFRDLPTEKLKDVTVAQATSHPNWSMGKKITIDSATLMNKGLEVIEAHYLFGVDYDNIDIVVHPQSIVHSMVETADSSVIAQMGWPDMRLPIMYTMSFPERISVGDKTWPRLDFTKANSLTFRAPDRAKYPAIDLAYAAGRAAGTMTGVLSAANEQSVQMFIEERISYLDIMKLNEACCEAHMVELIAIPTLEEIVHYDQWARRWVKAKVEAGNYSKVYATA
ncbi:hypothetical protein FOA52_002023 [Chlamydomonas sp. UWO 241]|nr:hypothetical protein FOA52_002023 [Chlamydomonas sp. UWO 241]